MAVPLVLCAGRLQLDLWHDEIYTVAQYASRGFTEIVSDYSAPNNHILYTLILAPVVRVSLAEPVLRLPSFVFAAVTLVLTYCLGLRLGGRPAAILAAGLLGTSVMYLVHAIQVRGYGLSMMLVAALVVLAIERGPKRLPWRDAAIVIVGAAAIYTIPTNVLFVAAVAIVAVGLVWREGGRRSAVIEAVCWLLACLLALCFYAPVIGQLRFAADTASRATLGGVARTSGQFFWAAWHDAWPLVIVALAALPTWLAHAESRSRSSAIASARLAWSLLAVACVMPFLACAALRMPLFERNFTPLLPVLAVLVAAPLGALVDLLAKRMPRVAADVWCLLALAVVLAAMLPAVFLYPGRLAHVCRERFAQDGYYNYYAADYHPAGAAAAIRADRARQRGAGPVIFADADQMNIVYYLEREGVDRGQPNVPGTARTYVVVPPRPDEALLQSAYGLSPEQLRAATVLAETGYYRVLVAGPLPPRK